MELFPVIIRQDGAVILPKHRYIYDNNKIKRCDPTVELQKVLKPYSSYVFIPEDGVAVAAWECRSEGPEIDGLRIARAAIIAYVKHIQSVGAIADNVNNIQSQPINLNPTQESTSTGRSFIADQAYNDEKIQDHASRLVLLVEELSADLRQLSLIIGKLNENLQHLSEAVARNESKHPDGNETNEVEPTERAQMES